MPDETQEKNTQLGVQEEQRKEQPTMKWYKQSAIWAIIISTIALILSQLPPIGAWLPRNEVKVEISNKIGLPSNMGVSGCQLLIDLKNIGNRSLTISKLELEIVYPTGITKHIAADSYIKILPGQPDAQYFPITSIKLNSGDGWSEMVMFYPTSTPSEEEEMSRIKLQTSQSIFSKIRTLPPNEYNPNIPIEADPSVVAQATNFFNRRFDLEKGTYKASLNCDVNGQKFTLQAFEFILYDYHINIFKSQVDDYKYGFGVYAPSDQNKQVWVSISKGN